MQKTWPKEENCGKQTQKWEFTRELNNKSCPHEAVHPEYANTVTHVVQNWALDAGDCANT